MNFVQMPTGAGIIYKAANTLNSKVYIGQTTYTLAHRKSNHAYRAKKGDKRTAFQAALLDEGFGNFQWEQIDSADSKEALDAKEKHWIAHYKADDPAYGYNLTEGGTHYSPSAEIRQKISKAKKGRAVPLEVCHKISRSMTGLVKSKETRKRMSEAKKGNCPSPETRRKIGEALKGRIAWNNGRKGISEETRRKLSDSHKGQNAGENHPRAIIAEAVVKAIKIDLQNGLKICDIARKYNVKNYIIKNIKYGKAWGWVNVPA